MKEKKTNKKYRPFVLKFIKKPDRDDFLVAFMSVIVFPLIYSLYDLFKDQVFFEMCDFWESYRVKFCQEFLQDFVYGLSLTIVIYTIRARIRVRKNEELVDKLKDSVNKILVSAETNEGNEIKRNMFYLTEIIDNQINVGEFKPDSLLIDQVDKCKSILSVTESPIALWLDPTYLFFLICQAVNSITKKVPQENITYGKSVKKYYKTRAEVLPFFKECSTLLDQFKTLGENSNTEENSNTMEALSKMMHGDDFRIYFMGSKEILDNKGLLEWFIAIHDFAGIHLLIIDREILEKIENMRNCYEKMRKVMQVDDNDKLDFAIRVYDNSEMWYAVRNFTQLHDVQIKANNDSAMESLSVFLKELAVSLETNKPYLFFPNELGQFNQGDKYNFQSIVLNEEKAQMIINK